MWINSNFRTVMRLVRNIGALFAFETAQGGHTIRFTVLVLKDGIDDIVSLNFRRRSALGFHSILFKS